MMKCLIITDHTDQCKTLTAYIEKSGLIQLANFCPSVESALSYLHENEIDLIFLSPELPESLEMLNVFQSKYLFILVSNSKKFAAEAYNLDVVDYILKLTYKRFLAAAEKAIVKNRKSFTNSDLIFIHSDNILKKLSPGEITYIEAYGDYINILSQDSRYMLNNSLKNLEEKLSANWFVRVHRKFIVNFHHIDFIEKNLLYIGKKNIPIGRVYREKLLDKLNLI